MGRTLIVTDPKDPNDVSDFTINWAAFLGTDTIITSSWIVPTGIVNNPVDNQFNTTTTTVWLSGGTAGQTYDIVNRITTFGSRTYDQTMRVPVHNL